MISEFDVLFGDAAKNAFFAFLLWLVTLVVTVVVGILVIKVLLYFLGKLLRRSPLTPTAVPFVLSVSKIFGYVLLGISVATSLKIVEASSIITALGAVGLAVSLAVKDSLSNLMGGMLLILLKTFKLGDYVEMEGVGGTVSEIGLIHTLLVTPDNKRISIPNGQVTNAKIVNYSAEDTRRVEILLTIDRHSDLEKAKAVLLATICAHPMALETPAPAVRAEGHTELGTKLSCRVWATKENYWPLFYDLTEQFKGKLDEIGVVMPVRIGN